MLFRFRCGLALLLIGLAFGGCSPTAENQTEEQKNPYFVAGKERVAARDFKGAIEAFEKALELNPRSPLTHFELGVLYEHHGEHNQDDYVAAMYHYNRAIKLRPNEYPADNARQRIAGCKQELVKSESLAPIYQTLQRDLEKLRDENQLLRSQLETGRAPARPPPTPSFSAASNNGVVIATRSNLVSASHSRSNHARPQPPTLQNRIAPPPGSMRTHTIKDGDTAYNISRRYGITVDALIALNPGLDPKRLRIGQIVNVPSS